MTVDLGAAAENWRAIGVLAKPAEAAAVVKADGYGCGMIPVARALKKAGAKTFFVATAAEGEELRREFPGDAIYVLNGFTPGEAARLAASDLRPVLNCYDEFAEWRALASRPPAAVQIDTGMNRTGFSHADTEKLIAEAQPFGGVDVALIVSHLACADDAQNKKNAEQLARFKAVLARLPKRPATLAASAGVLLGRDYCFDMVRPGIGLYGGNPRNVAPNPMRMVVALHAPIVAVRRVDSGETVGYGATHSFQKPALLATIAIGYADGLMRSLSNKGEAAIGGARCPIVGRVSMDLVVVDASDAKEADVKRGAMAEFLGPTIGIDDAARAAGTLPYEYLTRIGARVERVYIGGAS